MANTGGKGQPIFVPVGILIDLGDEPGGGGKSQVLPLIALSSVVTYTD